MVDLGGGVGSYERGTPVQLSIEEQPLDRKVHWFRGGLVCRAHGIWYHSTLRAVDWSGGLALQDDGASYIPEN